MMNEPLVSICLPNLNTLPYLAERFDSIFKQSFQNWELLVYDSYSDDGAWEYIREIAVRDPRIRAWQGPREGTPGSWNPCIHEAKGEYVYVATSDDTMAPDCLEKLVAALQQHKECDLAHCPLVVIDQVGDAIPGRWPRITVFADGIPEMVNRRHVRSAPHDGLLHLTGRHVCLSITQLLIRRSLFARIGYFPSKWGPVSDFNWEMKAFLVANMVHVPDTWASWRVYPGQATALAGVFSLEYDRKIEEMIQDAVQACEAYLDPAVVAGLKSHWLKWTRDMRTYNADLRHSKNALRRRLYQVAQIFNGPPAVRSQFFRRLLGRRQWDEAPDEIRRWLASLGLGSSIVPEHTKVVKRFDSLADRVSTSAN